MVVLILAAQVNGRQVTLGVPIRRPRPQLPPAPQPSVRSPERELSGASLAAVEVDRKALIRVCQPGQQTSHWPLVSAHEMALVSLFSLARVCHGQQVRLLVKPLPTC